MNKDKVIFKKDNVEEFLDNWSRNYKHIGVPVKSEKKGKVELSEDKELAALAEKYEDELIIKGFNMYDSETGDRYVLNVWYVLFNNTSYKKPDLKEYHTGASNTSSDTKVRLTFLIEEHLFKLEVEMKTRGHYPEILSTVIEDLEEKIEDILDQEKSIKETGIIRGTDSDYTIIVLSDGYYVRDIPINIDELKDHLVKAEIVHNNLIID